MLDSEVSLRRGFGKAAGLGWRTCRRIRVMAQNQRERARLLVGLLFCRVGIEGYRSSWARGRRESSFESASREASAGLESPKGLFNKSMMWDIQLWTERPSLMQCAVTNIR